jgi:hypothetical protein
MAAEVVVANPRTGEALGALDTLPPAILAETLYEIRQQVRNLKRMETALADELARRVAIRERRVYVVGAFEVSAKQPMKSDWDGDELEGVLRDLLDRGVVHAGELTEVIRKTVTVSASAAQRLVDRLDGEAREAVERCRRWIPNGRARVEVERSAELLPTTEDQLQCLPPS